MNALIFYSNKQLKECNDYSHISFILISILKKLEPEICLDFLNNSIHYDIYSKISDWFGETQTKEYCLQNHTTETVYCIKHKDFDINMKGEGCRYMPFIIHEPWCLEYAVNQPDKESVYCYLEYCNFEQAYYALSNLYISDFYIKYNKNLNKKQAADLIKIITNRSMYFLKSVIHEISLKGNNITKNFKHALINNTHVYHELTSRHILKYHDNPWYVFNNYDIRFNLDILFLGKNYLIPATYIKKYHKSYNGISIWSPQTHCKFKPAFKAAVFTYLICTREFNVPKFVRFMIIQYLDHSFAF